MLFRCEESVCARHKRMKESEGATATVHNLQLVSFRSNKWRIITTRIIHDVLSCRSSLLFFRFGFLRREVTPWQLLSVRVLPRETNLCLLSFHPREIPESLQESCKTGYPVRNPTMDSGRILRKKGSVVERGRFFRFQSFIAVQL